MRAKIYTPGREDVVKVIDNWGRSDVTVDEEYVTLHYGGMEGPPVAVANKNGLEAIVAVSVDGTFFRENKMAVVGAIRAVRGK